MSLTKILIVEDEYIIAEDLKSILLKLGYKVTAIALTGEAAFREVEKDMPDLILMDVMLKGSLDGIQVTENLMSKYSIPVIYLTANTDEATLERAQKTRAFGYILKPFEEKELYTNIELALNKRKIDKEILKRRDILQLIADFDVILSRISLNEILDNVFNFFKERLNIKYCTIFLLDDYEKSYKRYASKSVEEDLVETLPEVKESLFYLAEKNDKSIYINKGSLDEKDELAFFRSFLKEIEFDSAFMVKMFDKGAFKGCINVIDKDEIPEDTRNVLELISHRLCMSIQNSTLFEELTESENKFRNLADSLPQTIIETDFNHKIIYANSNMFETFGYSREDVEKELYASQLIEDKYCEKYFKAVELMIKEDKKTGLEYAVKRRNGDVFPAIIYTGILYKKGAPAGILSVIADISSQKLAEEESLKLKKLESLGILAGGIAHDFNNILTAILGNVTLAKIYSDPEDKIFEVLKEAERACIRSKDLTQQLLTFSKGGLPVKKVASIKNLIEESVIFILRGSNIKPEFKFGENIDKVEMDEGQINQVINNLIINSVQAMPEGGAITVGCENISFDINNPKNFKSGDYVKITIEDRGIGISEEHLGRIFAPYFTTKQKGSGLGLAVTHSIINKHNGYLDVSSKQGVGTVFYIYLPSVKGKGMENKKNNDVSSISTGNILVMDDEEAIREITSRILIKFGFKVDLAEDGEKAIELYKKAYLDNNPYSAVLMDLTIPGGMGGKEAIKKLIEFDPKVKAVVTSGYSNDAVLNNFKEFGFKGIVVKPFKIEDFIKVINEVILSD